MEDEYLTDKQIFDIWNHKHIDEYRVYFTKDTGDIYAISNEILPVDCASVEVEFLAIERFVTGKDHITFFRIEIDDEGAVKFIHKKESPVLFKSNIIEYIRVVENNNATLKVEWTKSAWIFSVADKFLDNARSKSLNSKINFFVTLENNINYLIRQLDVQIGDLVKGPVTIPFVTAEESNIKKISMFTLPFFETYGMTINEN